MGGVVCVTWSTQMQPGLCWLDCYLTEATVPRPVKMIPMSMKNSLKASNGKRLFLLQLQISGAVGLWVPDRSSTSCDLGILVDQPTESVATSELPVRR